MEKAKLNIELTLDECQMVVCALNDFDPMKMMKQVCDECEAEIGHENRFEAKKTSFIMMQKAEKDAQAVENVKSKIKDALLVSLKDQLKNLPFPFPFPFPF